MTHSSDHKEKLFSAEAAGRQFTLILNDAIRDNRLSWRAKGILAGCLSFSGTKFSKQWIIDNGTEGRDAVIAALKELREFGYLQNKTDRCEKTGRVLGEYYLVTDVAISADRWHRRPGNPDAGFPDAGKPHSGIGSEPIHANTSVRDRVLEKDLTGVSTVPACCAGAGNTGIHREPPTEASHPADAGSGQLPLSSSNPKGNGDGVGKESEETPRKGNLLSKLPFPKSLEQHKEKIIEFWRGKQGAKTLRSWKMQMTELEKLKVKYGDEALDEQLNAAILAGNWHGIRVVNYERYGIDTNKKRAATVDMNIHPSYRPLSYE
jgi:hypothetical protein